MCALCVEIQKDKMNFREVGKALGEFVVPQEHADEFQKVIEKKFGKDDARKLLYPSIYEGTD